jgi:hypothetical protein
LDIVRAIHHFGQFSLDLRADCWGWTKGTAADQLRIWKDYEAYDKWLLYFLGHDPAVPEKIREKMLVWGIRKSSGVAAVMAEKAGVAVQDREVPALQKRLVTRGQKLFVRDLPKAPTTKMATGEEKS